METAKVNRIEKTFQTEKIKLKKISRERVGRILIGVSVLSTLILSELISKYFLWALIPICINLIQSGITDKCLARDLVDRLGFPSEKECGRQEFLNQNK